jgi:DNA-binding transcriptional LysR family regulator
MNMIRLLHFTEQSNLIDRLTAMRTFVEIVDRGSLTAAAEAMDRSQPTVVRTLAALETHLGARLLHRTTRRMSLTPEGREYLERCRHILADVDEAERAVMQDEDDPRGELRMTAPIQFGQLHIAPALSAFLQRYQQVNVDLVLLDRNVDLVEEGFDLALRIGHLADSSMIAVRLGEVNRVVCASPELLLETATPDHPNALSGLPCIRLHNLPRASEWTFHENGHNLSVRVNGRFDTNQIAAARAACVHGVGFGQFLSYQVRQEINEGRLVPVLEAFQTNPSPVSLVWPGGRLVSTRLRALQNWLKDALRESLAFQ